MDGGQGLPVGLRNEIGERINPATEEKQDTLIAALSPLSGAGATGSVLFDPANTWTQVPSTVPTSDYILIVSKRIETGEILYSFANDSSPSATYGNPFSNNDLIIELKANQFLYMASDTDTDRVNWTTKII